MRRRGVHGPLSVAWTNGRRSVGAQLDKAWVGVDVGKTHHWVCVVDAEGKTLLSAKVANDEAEIVALLASTGSLAGQLIWAVDIIGAPSALLLALLARAGQSVRYASGRVVAAMSAAYAGEGKTDAKDAYVIAETARLRRDLSVIDTGTDLVRHLAVLTGHRADLIADRVRMINRLRDLMTSVFPSLERAFDYSSHKGALVLLTGYATPSRNPPPRTGSADWLVTESQGAWLSRGGRPRHRRGQSANGCAARARPDAPASSPSWLPPSLPSTTDSRPLMLRLRRPSPNIRRQRSSSRCPASDRSSALHC